MIYFGHRGRGAGGDHCRHCGAGALQAPGGSRPEGGLCDPLELRQKGRPRYRPGGHPPQGLPGAPAKAKVPGLIRFLPLGEGADEARTGFFAFPWGKVAGRSPDGFFRLPLGEGGRAKP